MADQNPPEKKVSKLSKLTQKYKNNPEALNQIVEIKAPLPPFNENGERQGNWLESYSFSTWYYDLNDQPFYIAQDEDDENDLVGILYDKDSNQIIPDFDEFGNPRPKVLRNEIFSYFMYMPKFEIILPEIITKNTQVANDKPLIKKAATAPVTKEKDPKKAKGAAP